jgi:uncharacterized paraquat-inducible protein A
VRRPRRAPSIAVSAWCPRCAGVVDMRLLPSTGIAVCPECGGAYTICDLQEAAYAEGLADGLAEGRRHHGTRRAQ